MAQRRPSSLSLMKYWQVEHTLSIFHKSYFPGSHLLVSLRLCWQPAHTQLLPLSTPTALSGQACCQRPQLWWRLQGYRSRAEAVSEERLTCAETVPLLLLLVEPNPGVQQHIRIARPPDPSVRPSDPTGRPSDPSGRPSDPLDRGRVDQLSNGWADGQTDGRNFTPFYRTLSPVGAAALLLSETSQHQRSRAREPLTS